MPTSTRPSSPSQWSPVQGRSGRAPLSQHRGVSMVREAMPAPFFKSSAAMPDSAVPRVGSRCKGMQIETHACFGWRPSGVEPRPLDESAAWRYGPAPGRSAGAANCQRKLVVIDPKSDGSSFDADEWPFFWLTHATGLYLSRLETSLKPVGLDIARWRVLMCIRPVEARSVSEIAELAIVKLPTMMKLIQRMEGEGLLRCDQRISDGRVTDVSLTAAGLEARKRAWHSASKIFSQIFSDSDGLDPEDLNKMLRLLVGRLSAA